MSNNQIAENDQGAFSTAAKLHRLGDKLGI
jgi:hypothetical protein